jgi:hypothetical protein
MNPPNLRLRDNPYLTHIFPILIASAIIALAICALAKAANEIEFVYPSGSTLYAIVRQPSTAKVWDAGSSLWDTWSDGDIGDYDIPLTDNSGDYYGATFPAAITVGSYTATIYERAGASPAVTDEILGCGSIPWTGTAVRTLGTVSLGSDGLDSISMTEPAAVATNFREAILAIWMRFYEKVTMTSSLLKVYNSGGTAITQQTLSDDSTTQTMQKATAP